MVTSKLGRKRIKHATYKYIQCCFHALKRYIRKDFPLQMEVFSYHIAEKTYNSGKKICRAVYSQGAMRQHCCCRKTISSSTW